MRRTVRTAGAAFLFLVPLGVTAHPTAAPAAPVVTTFDYTGSAQNFVVPAGITSITVDAYGAQGGDSDDSRCETGGFGGRVTTALTVAPGEVLQILVGGHGARYNGVQPDSNRGGFNGGGDGMADTVGGSRGGGGASDVRRSPYGLSDRLVVAGGGGGAGNLAGTAAGGAGGAPAGTAGAPGLRGGQPGTATAGGAAGPTEATVGTAATAGVLGVGGHGGSNLNAGADTGGGGGGGLYGGGGGGGSASSPGAGGGGGSSSGPAGAVPQTGVRGRSGDCSAIDGGPLHGMVVVSVSLDGGTFHALAPQRLFDTRDSGTALAGGDVLPVTVAGQLGVPATGADAVVLNVTVTGAAASGFLTVYPCGTAPPVVSNLNYAVGQTVANLVTVKLGAAGQVCFATKSTTHVVADVSGWYTGVGAPSGARFNPLPPARLVDTRDASPLDAGLVLALSVLGVHGVPATGVSAVTMNVTATGPTGAGFLTVFPCGGAVPVVSNLNYAGGDTVPNQAIVKLGDGGQVCVFSKSRTDVVVDVSGWYGDDGASVGSRLTAVAPARVLDTREGVGATRLPVAADGTVALTVLGAGGVPATGVDGVVMNVTVDQPATAGFVTVYPCGQVRPTASNLNYVAGQTVPNLVTVKVGLGGQVCLYSKARVELIADVSGWFGASGA